MLLVDKKKIKEIYTRSFKVNIIYILKKREKESEKWILLCQFVNMLFE